MYIYIVLLVRTGGEVYLYGLMDFRDFCIVAERKTRGETEMGVSAFRKASERHNSRVQGGFRVEYNRQKTGHVRSIQS